MPDVIKKGIIRHDITHVIKTNNYLIQLFFTEHMFAFKYQ